MLQANELRIGNWVSAHGHKKKMTAFLIFELHEEKGGYDRFYTPIPLTPEILEKAGFFRHESFWSITWGENGIEILKWDDYYNAFLYDLCRGRTQVITSVHQLQNLYFALTGTELNINL